MKRPHQVKITLGCIHWKLAKQFAERDGHSVEDYLSLLIASALELEDSTYID